MHSCALAHKSQYSGGLPRFDPQGGHAAARFLLHCTPEPAWRRVLQQPANPHGPARRSVLP
ncbi:hypothetical protein DYQ48_19550 [Xanthomonas hortorum]|nr:hypothetical protein BI317_23100 [Xanthomonas hortorum pv. gardneri]ASW46726.1 hypothetical protein XJ27_12695 [Xanthomonas hortorum]PPU48615.1 hypothetical protein XcyCFBP4188_05550 [Xanthomonas hortorum pv. cynarae]QEW16829.1 hypothetical protein DYQ48_19550 [Xanthomonas hortorum]